jgi:hypothetical protein
MLTILIWKRGFTLLLSDRNQALILIEKKTAADLR